MNAIIVSRFRALLAFAALMTLALASGCANDLDDPDRGEREINTGGTSMALTIDVDPESDVASVTYMINAVDCTTGATIEGGASERINKPLERLTLPVAGDEFAAFDEDSSHAFADHYVVLEAGCYDVLAIPTSEDGTPSEDCANAFASNVPVFDGQTTEILLLSQCEGVETGGLDSVVAFNTPPTVTALTYTPSKFALTCDEIEVCATASDPDGDPLRFNWSQVSGAPLGGHFTVTSTTTNADGTTQCGIIPVDAAGAYEFRVTVRDLLTAEDGSVITVSDFLASQGSAETSFDDLIFPLYVDDDAELCAELAPQ